MSVQSRFQHLAQQVVLFKGLSEDEVSKIFAKGMTMRAQKGETIFLKGTTGNTMYVVLGGSVAIFDGKKEIAKLTPGDMFGEMALISDEPRSATAVAAEESFLYVLSETSFHQLMTKRVAIQMLLNIIGTLSKRLRDSNAKLKKLEELQTV